nr:MAG TPA: hypothetical protein [Caudoviricetes sp.]
MNIETIVFSTLIFLVGFLLGERATENEKKKEKEEQNHD